MSQDFNTPNLQAVLYAAGKELERLTNDNGIPPGNYHVGGMTITLTIPEGTIISREIGPFDNGTVKKQATQNLYGWAFWTICIERLKKFNQWNQIKEIVIDAIRQVLQNKTTLKKELEDIDPDLATQVEALKKSFQIPLREEPTPRKIVRPEGKPLPLVNVYQPKQLAG